MDLPSNRLSELVTLGLSKEQEAGMDTLVLPTGTSRAEPKTFDVACSDRRHARGVHKSRLRRGADRKRKAWKIF